jgi:tungstate transport system substrate-binding protein
MSIAPASSPPPAAPGEPRARSRRRPLLLLAVLSALLGVPAAAGAAVLQVVGTSDVSDSGLSTVFTNDFNAAYAPNTMMYTGEGTGAAITDAEAGKYGALLVHAESSENNFVAGGFSLEPYGRAVFYGDFVLLGPASDPAHVLSGAAHDIVTAFEDIATAGAAGNAHLVSRDNTSGTAIAEHQIWAQVAQQSSVPASLTLCTVSNTGNNGGGEQPALASGACAGPDPLPQSDFPTWYITTGEKSQANNVEDANSCNYGPNIDCYVLTDRGTYDCLTTAACAGANAAPSNLGILVRNNSASAIGGVAELVNTFHAYGINPAAVPANSNTTPTLAEDFLNLLTSPTFQAALSSYLGSTNDPPFFADASPVLTASGLPASTPAGTAVTITGSLTNPVPGTPPLVGVPITLSQVGGAAAIPVASGTTDSSGNYSVTFTPSSSGSYQVSAGAITQLENAKLVPTFSDLLQPSAGPVQSITVQAAIPISGVIPTPTPPPPITVRITHVTVKNGALTLKATLSGAPVGKAALVKLLGRATSKVKVIQAKPKKKAKSGKGRSVAGAAAASRLSTVGKATVTPTSTGAIPFTIHAKLRRGFKWLLQLQYVPVAPAAAVYGPVKELAVH